ncbi:MAG TPA: ABC transporter ATP-binding protein [Corynebacterium nuruki]|jgi:NitT/TauT family transport system ATP-binding protein|uniref:ABC transporter ATP-binding protein n=1 Tax=Corynebacterium nuruki TaxID=1032851 RepID=A0A3D4SX33_9CORY|nr:ABC transporter ATP-binding protein [Corynebacterium nuruki]
MTTQNSSPPASQPSTPPKISVWGVSKHFPIGSRDGSATTLTALDETTFDIADGEFVSLLGPSGCGKSTLLDLLSGLTAPDSGEILVDGAPVTGPGPDRGIVFQQYALLPWRTAQGNIEFALENSVHSRRQRRETARHFLDLVGLTDFADRYPAELSGGMKQRIAIARSLSYDPSVLLMDEPFAALDAFTRESLQDLLLDIRETTRKTIVFVTHSIDEAVYLSDRIAVMTARPGRIRAVEPVLIDRSAEDVRSSAGFRALRHELWLQLQQEVHA